MVQRLIDAQHIYQRLRQLVIGKAIPDEVYVSDRADGGIPRWVVIQRRPVQGDGVRLLVEDQSPEQMRLKATNSTATLPRREWRPRR